MRRAFIVAFLAIACARTTERFSATGSVTSASAVGAAVDDGLGNDLLFQSDTAHLSAHWHNFSGAISGYEHNASVSAACEGSLGAESVSDTEGTLSVSLQEGQKYFNCVRALSATGEDSDWVASDGVTIDATSPAAPSTLNAFSQFNQVSLSWNIASDDHAGLASYEVAYCSPAPCALPDTPQLTGVTSNSIVVTGLQGCVTFQFAVRARDNAGNASAYSPFAQASAEVPPPANLKVVGNVGRAEIAFDAVTGATDYDVCYGEEPGACDVVALSTGGKTAMFLDGLPPETLYFAARTISNGCASDETSEVQASLAPVVERTTITSKPGCLGLNFYGYAVAALPASEHFSASNRGSSVGVTSRDWRDSSNCSATATGFIEFVAGPFSGQFGPNGADGSNNWGTALAPVGRKGDDDFLFLAAASGTNTDVYNLSGGGYTLLSDAGHNLGNAIADIGDLNGDAVSDFAVLAANDTPGKIFLYNGATPSAQVGTPMTATVSGGFSSGGLIAGGDIDGDGTPDVIVSSATVNAATGSVFAFSGATRALLFSVPGATNNGFFGSAIAQLGDLDNDGVPEFAVGESNTGHLRLYSANMSHPLFNDLPAPKGSGQFSTALSGGGDFDGDGILDLIVGAKFTEVEGVTAGRVYVLSGRDLSVIFTLDGATNSLLGTSVAYAYSLAGNGQPALATGAPGFSTGTIDGTASVYTMKGQLGLLPAEIVTASGDDGIRPAQTIRVAKQGTQQFAGVDGTAPYTYVLTTNRSGAVLAAGGLYTAGPTGGVFDTVRVIDRKKRSYETRVYVQATTEWPLRAPNRPHSVAVTAATANSFSLSWNYNNKSASGGVETPTGFLIEYREPAQSWQSFAVNDPAARAAMVSGLPANTPYLVRVKTVTAISDSLASATVGTATTP